MELLAGRVTIDDLDEFVDRLGAIGDEHGVTVQAVDARYVVDGEHLSRAVELADRAIERGEAIADDRAMEILCYAAGTRQIREALEIGVSRGEDRPVVLLVDGGEPRDARRSSSERSSDGGDEAATVEALRPILDEIGPAAGVAVGDYDEQLVRSFYEIGDAELAATDAGIPDLVRERVALLVVER